MLGEFSSLIEDRQISTVVLGFEKAIAKSFEDDKSTQTRSEVKRRFEICRRVFKELRGDKGWSVQRILDHLPTVLRCELDGQPWTPDDRLVWMPSD
jgi:ribosomal protein S14